MPEIPKPSEPAEPAKQPVGAAADAPIASGGQPPKPCEDPYPAPAPCPPKGTGVDVCCAPVALEFPCFEQLEGIQGESLRTAGDAYYEGMFERVGAFRAIDELTRRFLGGLNLGFAGELRGRLTNYMRREPLRIAAQERGRALSLFGDATLERLLVRVSDAVIAFDLSRRPGGIALTPTTLPEAAAQLDVIAAIENLELFLDGAGGGGVSFIADEVGRQLMEIIDILNDPDLRCHVAGNDVDDLFAVIAGLLEREKDRPSDWEARQMARQACSGRKIFRTLADQVGGKLDLDATGPGGFGVADLNAIIALVYDWRAAHGSLYGGVVEVAAAVGDAAAQSQAQVIRLRRRGSS
jgi:hypothetical protein